MNAQPKALPATDLSGAFGKPSRAADIKLPPAKRAARKAPAAPQRPVSPVPDPEPVAAAAEPSTATSRKGAGGRKPAKKATRASKKAAPAAPSVQPGRPTADQAKLVLWTPRRIRTRMQTLRATSDTLYRDMVLDALEGTVDQLPDLIAKSSQPTTVKTRLFEREETVAKADPEPRVQLTIGGFLNSQLEVIDGLVEEFGAPSRSALVNAALDAFLPTS